LYKYKREKSFRNLFVSREAEESLAFVLLHFLDARMILCILGDRNDLLSARNILQLVPCKITIWSDTTHMARRWLYPCLDCQKRLICGRNVPISSEPRTTLRIPDAELVYRAMAWSWQLLYLSASTFRSHKS
jgi:hypothetical protein